MENPWHLYVMALLYIAAGVNHFKNPKMYIRIIPPFFKNPSQINLFAGIAEILLGILLLYYATTSLAAWGIIALLIAVFPSHIYMLTNEKAASRIPRWLLWLRLPLQLLLIYWAYLYT